MKDQTVKDFRPYDIVEYHGTSGSIIPGKRYKVLTIDGKFVRVIHTDGRPINANETCRSKGYGLYPNTIQLINRNPS